MSNSAIIARRGFVSLRKDTNPRCENDYYIYVDGSPVNYGYFKDDAAAIEWFDNNCNF